MQPRELLVRECEGTRAVTLFPCPSWRICAHAGPAGLIGFARVAQRQIDRLGLVVPIKASIEQIIPAIVRHFAQHATNSVGVIIMTVAAVIHSVPAGAVGMTFQ